MRSISFPAADLEAIAYDRYHHPDPRVQRKLEVPWLKHQGLTHAASAALAGVSRSSVQRYLDEYLQGGLEQVRRCPWTGPASALDAHRHSLEEHFRHQPPRSTQEAQDTIARRTGIRRGLTQVRRFLRRLGLKPRKVAAIPIPPKSSAAEHAQEQAEFLEGELDFGGIGMAATLRGLRPSRRRKRRN